MNNSLTSNMQVIANEVNNHIENLQLQNGTPTTELSVQNVSNIMTSTAGSNNNRRKPSVCDICSKVFSRYDNLERHRRTHEGQKLYKCNICGKSFAQSSYLKVHYRTHSGERPFKCNICGYAFSRSDHLIRHIRTHHSNRQVTTTSESRKSCDNPPPVVVSSFSPIQKPASQQPRVTAHQPSNESNDNDNDDNHHHHHHHHHQADHEHHPHHHQADHEHLSYGYPHLLQRRILDKHGCCLIKSTETDKEAKHGSDGGTGTSKPCQVNASQPGTSELTFLNCEVCWKAFSQAPHGSLHKCIHTAVLPYQCQICHKSFSRKDNLKRHISTHDGAKLFSCEVCSKAFSRRAYLKVHNRIHSGERPYKCTICDYAFTRNDHLIRHNRPNKGERKFSCVPPDLKDDRGRFRTNGAHQQNFSSPPPLQATVPQNQNSTLAVTTSASDAPSVSAHHTVLPSSSVSLPPAHNHHYRHPHPAHHSSRGPVSQIIPNFQRSSANTLMFPGLQISTSQSYPSVSDNH